MTAGADRPGLSSRLSEPRDAVHVPAQCHLIGANWRRVAMNRFRIGGNSGRRRFGRGRRCRERSAHRICSLWRELARGYQEADRKLNPTSHNVHPRMELVCTVGRAMRDAGVAAAIGMFLGLAYIHLSPSSAPTAGADRAHPLTAPTRTEAIPTGRQADGSRGDARRIPVSVDRLPGHGGAGRLARLEHPLAVSLPEKSSPVGVPGVETQRCEAMQRAGLERGRAFATSDSGHACQRVPPTRDPMPAQRSADHD